MIFMKLPARKDSESLWEWERRVFQQEMSEEMKLYCKNHLNRHCNLECQRISCQFHPEYDKPEAIN